MNAESNIDLLKRKNNSLLEVDSLQDEEENFEDDNSLNSATESALSYDINNDNDEHDFEEGVDDSSHRSEDDEFESDYEQSISNSSHDDFEDEISSSNNNISTLSSQKLHALTGEINRLEEKLLQPKKWDLRGEVVGKDRPENSLLELPTDIERYLQYESFVCFVLVIFNTFAGL